MAAKKQLKQQATKTPMSQSMGKGEGNAHESWLDDQAEFDDQAFQVVLAAKYRAWLLWRLQGAGGVPVADLKAQAERLGFDWYSVDMMADQLSVERSEDREEGACYSFWSLPMGSDRQNGKRPISGHVAFS